MSTSIATVRPVLHHVNLKTRQLQEMIDWYGLVVGMTPQHQYEGGAWLTNDGANHRLALIVTPGLVDDPDKLTHTGIHHIAFEYGSMGDLLDTFVRLRDEDILPHACLDHGMTTSFYYVDPDGNSVELQSDNFAGDWARSSRFLSTPEFQADPIGMNIDPAALVAARNEGVREEEIHRRAYAGEFAAVSPLDLRLP
jgi:catechol 2,3-dioxygenase